MSMSHLGDTIDIHVGGHDLVFPHHVNEIGQSEAATGQQFANNPRLTDSTERFSQCARHEQQHRKLDDDYQQFVVTQRFDNHWLALTFLMVAGVDTETDVSAQNWASTPASRLSVDRDHRPSGLRDESHTEASLQSYFDDTMCQLQMFLARKSVRMDCVR
jgi:hypothetical protein